MKESYDEGLATRIGSESCVEVRKGVGEALTGVRAGRILSRERVMLRGADAVSLSGRPHSRRRQSETQRNPARSRTPCMCGNTSRENRELPCPPAKGVVAGREGKSKDEHLR